MSRFNDLTGRKFGKLTAIEPVGNDKFGGKLWLCKCECGGETVALAGNLVNGRYKGCGCERGKALKEDLTGKRFGMLTVLEEAEPYISLQGLSFTRWKCRCDCGSEKIAKSADLKNGKTNNCGCQTRKKKAKAKTIHGLSKTRIKGVWLNMLNRCNNPNCYEYESYGGRGITVCEEWRKLENFAKWAYVNGYDENAEHGECTIDRIDNNKGYFPDNCRWITNKEQANNKRNNHFIEFKGKRQTIAQWAEELGINKGTLSSRILNGWSLEKALRKEKYSTHGEIKETGD